MKRIICAAVVAAGLAASAAVQAATNNLSWGLVINATSYGVERKAAACTGSADASGVWSAIGTTANTSFVDDKVTEGQAYCYRVNASNTAGTSGYSNTAGRTVPFTVPAAPGGLTVQGGP